MRELYDPYSLEMHEDPYPTYKLLRDRFPLYLNQEHGLWTLSRYHDVQGAARDWETFSSTAGADLDDTGKLIGEGNFLDEDPPRHDELRHVVRDHFKPRAIKALEERVRQRARELLDDFAERGSADLAQEYAWPLPAGMVCELLGFPPEDHPQLLQWFTDSLHRIPGQKELPDQAWKAAEEMRSYFADTAEERRKHPKADVLTTMVAAAEAGRISPADILGMCAVMFLAGIETTSSLISNSLLLLHRHPDQRRALAANRSSMPAAIEELLRFESPVQFIARNTTREVELHGQTIPAESRVVLIYASANRDDRKFADPDRLDLARRPTRHLAFGEGIHHCIGAPLARLEGRIALDLLLERIPEYEIAGPVQRLYTHNAWGLERLPVEFSATAATAVA